MPSLVTRLRESPNQVIPIRRGTASPKPGPHSPFERDSLDCITLVFTREPPATEQVHMINDPGAIGQPPGGTLVRKAMPPLRKIAPRRCYSSVTSAALWRVSATRTGCAVGGRFSERATGMNAVQMDNGWSTTLTAKLFRQAALGDGEGMIGRVAPSSRRLTKERAVTSARWPKKRRARRRMLSQSNGGR